MNAGHQGEFIMNGLLFIDDEEGVRVIVKMW